MQEFISGVVSELLKGFAGEAGKAGARALFSSGSASEPPAASEDEHLDPLHNPWDMAHGFLHALAQGEPDTAWTYCDPFVADDPDRHQRLDVILQAVAPVSWAVQNMHVPKEWREGDWLPWGVIETVITYPRGDGGFDALPALITMLNGDDGWRVADVHWQEDTEEVNAPALPAGRVVGWPKDWESSVAEVHVLPCTRCSESFTIPAGYGVLKVRCPACWTQQEVET